MKHLKYILLIPLFIFSFILAQDEAPAVEETPATTEEAAAPEETPATTEEAAAPEETPVSAEETSVADAPAEEGAASPLAGFSVGAAPSFGFISGETFTNIPVGATVVITTPYGFKLGALDFTVSAAFGGYTGSYDSDDFNPVVAGLGGNLTLANFVFAEGHAGLVGEGLGVRGFAGVTLEHLMKKSFNLPFNVLVGGEGFIGNDIAGVGNPSYWGGLGVRLDYSF